MTGSYKEELWVAGIITELLQNSAAAPRRAYKKTDPKVGLIVFELV